MLWLIGLLKNNWTSERAIIRNFRKEGSRSFDSEGGENGLRRINKAKWVFDITASSVAARNHQLNDGKGLKGSQGRPSGPMGEGFTRRGKGSHKSDGRESPWATSGSEHKKKVFTVHRKKRAI